MRSRHVWVWRAGASLAMAAVWALMAGTGTSGRTALAATPSLMVGVHRDPTDVSAILQPILAKHEIPGMVAAIVEGDKVVAIGAAGVRKAGAEEKVTTGDLFHIGSCTKSMTATMIGTLVEEGKLSWTTTIGEVFTDLGEKMQPEWKGVTLEQLLTHRAGVPSDLGKDGLWGRLWKNAGAPGPEQRRMLVEGVLSWKPESPAGTKYLYANAGFAIAGAMAEKVTGKSWEDLMRERLFTPLGMDSAGFGAPGTKGTVDQPRGHYAKGEAVEPGVGADNPAAIGPGGIVHCTVSDWAKYVSLHVRGDAADPKRGAKIVKAETFDKLHTPPEGAEPKYAMGWSVTSRPWAGPGQRVLTHNGSNTMWFAVCWLAPEKDFAVLVMCNKGGAEADKGCDEAAAALIHEHGSGPKKTAPATGG